MSLSRVSTLVCYEGHMRTEKRRAFTLEENGSSLVLSLYHALITRAGARSTPQAQWARKNWATAPMHDVHVHTPVLECTHTVQLMPPLAAAAPPPQARRAQPSREKAASTINLVAFPL